MYGELYLPLLVFICSPVFLLEEKTNAHSLPPSSLSPPPSFHVFPSSLWSIPAILMKVTDQFSAMSSYIKWPKL